MTAAPNENTASSKENKPVALIAGGAGFLGSHLAATLLTQNFQVIIVDNLSSGSRENLKEILTSENLTFIQADINATGFQLPADLKIDYVFHFASVEEVEKETDFSLDTLLVNSLGTRQLLEIAREKSAKFILLSAADLYSGAISSSSLRYYFGKTPEDEAVLSSHEAKRFAEALAFEYWRKFNVPITIIRVKDVYGPKMNLTRGGEIADLLKEAVKGENLVIYGDGLKILNPTFVSDVIFGVVKASLGDFSGEIFILVNSEKVTVEAFAKTVKLVAGSGEIEKKKEKEKFIDSFNRFDLENTKEKLGWSPKVSLTEGVSSVIQSYHLEKAKEELAPTPPFGEDKLQELAIVEQPLPLAKVPAPVIKVKKKGNPLLRWGIFGLSLLLLIVTIFYPSFALGIESNSGKENLTRAISDLDSQKNQTAIAEAQSAQESFLSASSHLQSISWLLKIVGFGNNIDSYDHALAASASLATSYSNFATADQVLVSTASSANLTAATATAKLNEALNNLYASSDKLQEAKLNLEGVDWGKIPSALLPNQNYLNTKINSLEGQVNQLITEIEKALNKTPA